MLFAIFVRGKYQKTNKPSLKAKENPTKSQNSVRVKRNNSWAFVIYVAHPYFLILFWLGVISFGFLWFLRCIFWSFGIYILLVFSWLPWRKAIIILHLAKHEWSNNDIITYKSIIVVSFKWFLLYSHKLFAAWYGIFFMHDISKTLAPNNGSIECRHDTLKRMIFWWAFIPMRFNTWHFLQKI